MTVHRHKVQRIYTTHRSRFANAAGTLFNYNYMWYLNFTIKHALVYGYTSFSSIWKRLQSVKYRMLETFYLLFADIPSQSILSKRYTNMRVWKFYHAAIVFRVIYSLLVARLCGNLLWFLWPMRAFATYRIASKELWYQ